MHKYIISTDNTTDLPKSFIQKEDLPILFMTYSLDGEIFDEHNELPAEEFYSRMRAGALPTTAQANPTIIKETFLSLMEEHHCDILHLSFSSGLSGTYNNCRLASQELEEEDLPHRVVIVDTLCASMGEGLLVYKALQNQKRGMSLDENVQWLEEHKANLVHIFTVDDLNHLHRGGRVSKAAAIVGTMINIKPILHVDNDGCLIPINKVRGRKKSLTALADYMDAHLGSYRYANDIVFISHGDAPEDAAYVQSLVEERFGIKTFMVNHIGPTIGTHSGPGTVALFFLGDTR